MKTVAVTKEKKRTSDIFDKEIPEMIGLTEKDVERREGGGNVECINNLEQKGRCDGMKTRLDEERKMNERKKKASEANKDEMPRSEMRKKEGRKKRNKKEYENKRKRKTEKKSVLAIVHLKCSFLASVKFLAK